MIPIQLRLRNFLCYVEPDAPLDFTGFRLACLAGDNGHGKSAILDAVTWALCTALASNVMARTSSLSATLVTFLSGTPVLLLMAVPSLVSQDWRGIGAMGWLGVAFSGIVAIGLGYLAWNTGLGAVGSTRTVVYSNLTPVVAAALAWATLGERWTFSQVGGAAVVLVGIALTRRGTVVPASPGLHAAPTAGSQ